MKTLWSKWKHLMERVGNVQIAVVFSLLYFIFITPLGFIVNLKKDYFRKKQFPQWLEIEGPTISIKRLKEQG